jgi:predicted acylesterase/phospholipase RssA
VRRKGGRKVGFVFSGAASRIAQEYVLMRCLVEGRAFAGLTAAERGGASGPGVQARGRSSPARREPEPEEEPGRPVLPDVLAGSSSGALSAVALNAILLSEGLIPGGGRSCSFGWHDYEELLRTLRNDHVFEGGGLIPEALEIIRRGSIYDTAPLKRTVQDTVETCMGFRVLGDLPIRTYLSVVERDSGRVYRLRSDIHSQLRLLDVLMASTAIPVVFPPWRLRLPRYETAVPCIDGGTGRDGIPVEAIREEHCDTLFIIRPMRFDPQKPWNKSRRLARLPIIDAATRTLLYMQEALSAGALLRAPYYARRAAYAYLPELPCNYSFLDFDSSGKQVQETRAWTETQGSGPVLLRRSGVPEP